jgi:hypothetical protein
MAASRGKLLPAIRYPPFAIERLGSAARQD